MIQQGPIERFCIKGEQSTFEKIDDNSTIFYILSSISLWSKKLIFFKQVVDGFDEIWH